MSNDFLAKGTRLIDGEEAKRRRDIINVCGALADDRGFNEIVLPAIEPVETYVDKIGDEVRGQMYVFPDKKGRELCLRPEGTATLQRLARSWKGRQKDVRVWYESKCYRYEAPQKGRYREFTQLGVEVLNPREDCVSELVDMAEQMVRTFVSNYEVKKNAERGLAYYTADGFEIICPDLGAQKQVVGGGSYAEGVGFAIGVDRLVIASMSCA